MSTPTSEHRQVLLVVAAVAAGVAAGAAAALTATFVPYAVSMAISAMRTRRRHMAREARQKSKDKVRRERTGGGSREGAAYREAILKGLLHPKDIEVSFDSLPYFLSEATRSALLDATFVALKRPDFLRFTAALTSMTPRILLTGPPGSELCQESLVKALAKYLGVKLLIFDSTGTFLEASPSSRRANQDYEAEAVPDVGPEEGTEIAARKGDMARWMGPGLVQGPTTPSMSALTSPVLGLMDPGLAVTARFGADGLSSNIKSFTPSSPRVELEASTLPQLVTPGKGAAEVPFPSVLPSLPYPKSSSRSRTAQVDSKVESKAGSAVAETARRSLRKGDRVRYMGTGPSLALTAPVHSPPGVPPVGLRGRVVLVLEDNPAKVGVRFDRPLLGGTALADLCEEGYGAFCNVAELRLETAVGEDVDKLIVEALLEVIAAEAARDALLVFIRHAERSIAGSVDRYLKLERLERSDMRLVIIGSHTGELRKEKPAGTSGRASNLSTLLDLTMVDTHVALVEETPKSSRTLQRLFPNRIVLNPPQDAAALREWGAQIDADTEALLADANMQRLKLVLTSAHAVCDSLPEVRVTSQSLTLEAAEKVVGWGASRHLQEEQQARLRHGKLTIPVHCIRHGLELLEAAQPSTGSQGTRKSLKEVVCENEFEKLLLAEVIPPDELGVTFEHIGALEGVKETLRELVMLPLQRPELFLRGQLNKPVRGLLLFGPPGTGKTMLAKAVAKEAGANFLNISMATIASKWFGEAEKYVKAVFTLASKLAPAVIFIDEVDSMLGRRGKETEHSAMRKLKNELMASWDGLRTRERERVLLLAATNRPFDLDEAVVRRFPRRLLVDLPDAANRAKILTVILADEDLAPGFDVEELAVATDSYSGSDLRNLCTTAAYRRIREILDAEKREREAARAEGREPPPPSKSPNIRPLSMEDMKQAMEKVRSSVSADASSMLELAQWNDQYGEGGTRRIAPLSYFM